MTPLSPSAVAALAAALDEQREAVVETILAFDFPRGHWRIQRPDGQYVAGCGGPCTPVLFTPRAEQAMAFARESSARHFLDISRGSQAGRLAFRDCTLVCLA